MTRKHYNDLAERFGKDLGAMNGTGQETPERLGYWEAIYALVAILRSDNPRFDRERFYDAIASWERRAIATTFGGES